MQNNKFQLFLLTYGFAMLLTGCVAICDSTLGDVSLNREVLIERNVPIEQYPAY